MPILEKNPYFIILHIGTNDVPNKNENQIHETLLLLKGLNTQHQPADKGRYILSKIIGSSKKNANISLKQYVK